MVSVCVPTFFVLLTVKAVSRYEWQYSGYYVREIEEKSSDANSKFQIKFNLPRSINPQQLQQLNCSFMIILFFVGWKPFANCFVRPLFIRHRLTETDVAFREFLLLSRSLENEWKSSKHAFPMTFPILLMMIDYIHQINQRISLFIQLFILTAD